MLHHIYYIFKYMYDWYYKFSFPFSSIRTLFFRKPFSQFNDLVCFEFRMGRFFMRYFFDRIVVILAWLLI